MLKDGKKTSKQILLEVISGKWDTTKFLIMLNMLGFQAFLNMHII